MKRYLKKHYKFSIVVIILLIICISSTLYVTISKKNDEETLNNTVKNISDSTFTYTYKNESETIKEVIKFTSDSAGTKTVTRTIKDESTDDKKSEYEFTYYKVKSDDNWMIKLNINNTTINYIIDGKCIYEKNSPSIKFCK